MSTVSQLPESLQTNRVSDVFRMDCKDGMKQWPDKYFDLAICDPPYFEGFSDFGYMGADQSRIGVKRGNYAIPEWDDQIPDQDWLDEVVRISEHQIIWGINYFKFHHTGGCIIWDKVNGASSFSDAEIASCTFHDSVRMFRYMWNGMCQGKSIAEGHIMQGNKKLNEKRIHPTQKPVLLYDYLYKTYLPDGGKVIDTHLGSGSNRISAYKRGNIDFTAYEINERVYRDQEQRWKGFISQTRLDLK